MKHPALKTATKDVTVSFLQSCWQGENKMHMASGSKTHSCSSPQLCKLKTILRMLSIPIDSHPSSALHTRNNQKDQ